MKSPKGQWQGLLWARRGAESEGWLGCRRWTREGCEGPAGGGRPSWVGSIRAPAYPCICTYQQLSKVVLLEQCRGQSLYQFWFPGNLS
jgi:hypothetical protein